MTAQSHEKLLYKGKWMDMAAEPLSYYLITHKIPIEPIAPNTACWRGYYGKWKIKNNQLFLTHLTGRAFYTDMEKVRQRKKELNNLLKAGQITATQNGKLLKESKKQYESEVELSIQFLFPGQDEVFASWFTGIVRIPQGELLHYIHMGYESQYERDLFLSFENGNLVGEKIVENV